MAKKNEQKRTLGFAAFGIGMCLLAAGAHHMSKPTNSKDFELVGKPFFEEFTSAEQARSLEVTAIDQETAESQQFSVAQKDGLWRIPSHYDYPAEAADRLAATATSVMGINRESLVGRLKSDHERFGVLDPLDVDSTDPETVGKRITIKDESDDTLVDLIIGKEAGDVVVTEEDRPMQSGEAEKYYYVRRPDETPTYKVQLNVDISTKFSDWIEPDLLQLNGSAIRRISVDNYELQEKARGLGQPVQIFKVPGDVLNFSREDAVGSWDLEGLNEKTEEVVGAEVSKIVNVLDEMKIVGVRPKHKYKDQQLLSADLKVMEIPELQANPREFNMQMAKLQSELARQGFNFIQDPDLTLVSTGGELVAGTDEGIVYSLNFGKAVEDDEVEIEIGDKDTGDDVSETTESEPNAKTEAKEESQETGTENVDATESENDDSDKAEEEEVVVKNRYLMIRAFFDSALLGEVPVKPIEPLKPVEPEGYVPPAADDKDEQGEIDEESPTNESSSSGDEAPAPGESDSGDEQDAEDPSGDAEESEANAKPERDPAFVEYDEALATYEQQSTEHTLNMTRYENDLKAYEERVKAAEKRVAELNERFGDWYYVIAADNLKALKSSRTDVVKEKEVDEDEAAKPDISFDMPDDLSAPPVDPAKDESSEGDGTDKIEDQDDSDSDKDQPDSDSNVETTEGQSNAAEGSEPNSDDSSESPESPEAEEPGGSDSEKDG